jgi:hypothetical protein
LEKQEMNKRILGIVVTETKKMVWGGKSLEETIAELKKRWNVIPDDLKPKWCTWKDIEELEKKAMAIG